jgi:predicted nicotinamide N-methyase
VSIRLRNIVLSVEEARNFILANAALLAPPHVPEIRLQLADEAHELWQRTEEELAGIGVPPPFWAFAWAGGQGLARYVLDTDDCVRGKTVLDFATGSGLVAVAAAMSGAACVTAVDIDPFCRAAVALNSAANGVSFDFRCEDLIGADEGWDVVLAGDVFYDKAFASAADDWFRHLSARGATVLIGDPKRAYLPQTGLSPLAVYEVPVTRALEDSEIKKTTVWRYG